MIFLLTCCTWECCRITLNLPVQERLFIVLTCQSASNRSHNRAGNARKVRCGDLKMSELQLRIVASQVEKFREAARIQQSFITKAEKKALLWCAERMPNALNSDHLTILGAAGMLLAGASYALSRFNRYALLLACFFLAVNWFGDSLDGNLARFRNQQRPRYGFYVDHILDSIGSVALMGGLAISGYMSPAIAISLLVLFLLLSIQSYLATYALGEFRMSFWSFGPTELRVLLAIGNLAVLRWPTVLHGHRLFDIGGAIGIAGMTAVLV